MTTRAQGDRMRALCRFLRRALRVFSIKPPTSRHARKPAQLKPRASLSFVDPPHSGCLGERLEKENGYGMYAWVFV